MSKKKWDIYLIQHSHTDIGYTARQEKIKRMHADFIRQAMDIVDSDAHPGFKWQCENFWQVENFMEQATVADAARFKAHVQASSIGLSATYLNMTELVDAAVMDKALGRARVFAEELGVRLESGMIADINGLSWGSVDLFAKNGMKNLYSCLHSHHGMFPIGMKQRPFFWESAGGEHVLVWNGEHYHFGNELHFAPGGGTSYMIQDELTRLTRPETTALDAEALDATEFDIMVTRLRRYLANVVNEGYPWDFMPFMVSGVITDNSPPSAAIAERIDRLNRLYPDEFNVRLSTLDEFFDRLRQVEADIPVYRGDWTDWWADGVGSTPIAVSVYKDAQRHYHLLDKLDRQYSFSSKPFLAKRMHEAEQQMLFFAEHTWGYSASISEPWSPESNLLDQKKQAYAANAHSSVLEVYDARIGELGAQSIAYGSEQKFRIINPHDKPYSGPARIEIEYWDTLEGRLFQSRDPLVLWCEERQSYLPYQIERAARAFRILIPLEMSAHEVLNIRIMPAETAQTITALNHAYIGADGVADIDHEGQSTLCHAYTKHFELHFDEHDGLVGLTDRSSGRSLLHPEAVAPFTGVYEVTDGRGNQTGVRRQMGRNRKSSETSRHFSKMRGLSIVETGPIFTTWKLTYSLEGTNFWDVYIRAYQELPIIETSIRFHKTSCWDPENLYVALPFTAGDDSELWIDKTAAVLRPGIDQLPGTNQEFWLGQNGLAWIGTDKQLLVAAKDAPLITLGSLEAHAIRLCDGQNRALNQAPAWSWLMNNFWETNFKADLGGFYQFDYVIKLAAAGSADDALSAVADLGQGLISFHT